MRYLINYCLILLPVLVFAQIKEVEQDTTKVEYLIIEGDSIFESVVNLRPVYILNNLKFGSKEERIRYLILRRKTLKVYPYAKLAADRLDSLNKRLETLTKKSDRNRYTKLIQKYIEEEFSEKLKKFSRTEGQILVKLIHRQTGLTTFELVKDLRSGWRAFWYNTTAKMFDISLKKEFDPVNVLEDYLIEDILQRSFQSGLLERQESAIKFDFYELTDKWVNKKKT